MKACLKKIMPYIWLVCFTACGDESGDTSNDSNWTETQLQAEIDGTPYQIDVRYYLDEQNGLTVYSDQDDVTDSNNDDLIFAIFQVSNGLQFDFVKEDNRWGSKVNDWENTGDKITGEGSLMPEDGTGSAIPVSFEMKL